MAQKMEERRNPEALLLKDLAQKLRAQVCVLIEIHDAIWNETPISAKYATDPSLSGVIEASQMEHSLVRDLSLDVFKMSAINYGIKNVDGDCQICYEPVVSLGRPFKKCNHCENAIHFKCGLEYIKESLDYKCIYCRR